MDENRHEGYGEKNDFNLSGEVELMGVPQIIVIVLSLLKLFLHAIVHGQPKKGTYSVLFKLIDLVFLFGLLIWGGFFK